MGEFLSRPLIDVPAAGVTVRRLTSADDVEIVLMTVSYRRVSEHTRRREMKGQTQRGTVMSHTVRPAMSLVSPGTDGLASPDPLADLVEAAARGDGNAWEELYERYTPLISSVCRRYRLAGDDADDVSQTVWLGLVQQLHRLREPSALPGWIVTTTKNEALRVIKASRRMVPSDPMTDNRFDSATRPELDDHLCRTDRRRALRDGLRQLRPEHRQLLLLLVADPQLSYKEISRRLGIPIGSIGPTRARCLRRLRDTTEIHALGTAA
jgi:RNA polymerase sigma factor (sigma-70 family)